MCHEAYEESLAASGINLKSFFTNPSVAIPIVHANIDFLRPIFCGDPVFIHLISQNLGKDNFEIAYIVLSSNEKIAKAVTRHVCINPVTRTRQQLPDEIMKWSQQYRV
jgi:1,4-dihydroxy-2-naphthoyl-CoA hydrolase